MINRLKWKRHYDKLMLNAKHRGKPKEYVEAHHIVPTSVGGENIKTNKVWLTSREHLIAHKLWARMECDPLKQRKALTSSAP
jgi:hypothetical protein